MRNYGQVLRDFLTTCIIILHFSPYTNKFGILTLGRMSLFIQCCKTFIVDNDTVFRAYGSHNIMDKSLKREKSEIHVHPKCIRKVRKEGPVFFTIQGI